MLLFSRNKIKTKTMGGKAVKNVTRIYKEEMLPTLHVLQEHLYQALGISIQDVEYAVCGSFLGKDSCGDIDIAFEWNKVKFPYNATKESITKRLNDLYVTLPDYYYNKGFDIHSIPFPIFNEFGRTDRYVQVDIMGVDNLEDEYNLDCAVEWDGEKYIVDVATPAHQAVVAEADRIRNELLEKGIKLLDTREGTTWSKE